MKKLKAFLIVILVTCITLSTSIVKAQEIKYSTGYIKDTIDNRDLIFEDKLYGNNLLTSNVIFESIDLRDKYMPDIYESQGINNSCVAYSTTRALEYQVNKAFERKYNTNAFKFNNVLSKNFLYYLSRYVTGNDAETRDSGSSFRAAFKVLMMTGSSIQNLHSDTSSIYTKPNFEAMLNANEYKINAYYTVNSLQGIVDSLKIGLPVLIGTDINAFGDAGINSGLSPKSELWNATTLMRANHGMTIVGIKNINSKWYFIIANSWGKSWGDGGYAYVDAQKMWDYNIEVAHVIVLDTFAVDLDRENSEYIANQELPKNTIIIGSYAYDMNYANNVDNESEIQNAIVNSNGNVYVKSADSKLINNIDNTIVSLDKITSKVGNRLIYKNRDGLQSALFLK